MSRNKKYTMVAALMMVVAVATVVSILSTSKKNQEENNSTVMQNIETVTTILEEETTTTAEEVTSYEMTTSETTVGKETMGEVETGNTDAETSTEPQMEATTGNKVENDMYPYYVKVNRVMNCVTVYKKDENGEYTVPYKAMVCSTGKNVGDTPCGTFRTSDQYDWRIMVDGTYSQYAYRINGPIMFHSVPNYKLSKDALEADQFNKLGTPASLGCIRLNVRDAKWLMQNCPVGTTVTIYDDASSPGPLGKPESIRIPEDHPYSGWDPYDPDPLNPWNKMSPSITGAKNKTINVSGKIDLLKGVKATDTCLNDITSSIKVTGSVDANTPGKYQITYKVRDLLGREATSRITVTVKGEKTTTTKATTKATAKATTKKTTTQRVTTTEKKTTEKLTTEKVTTEKITTQKQSTENETTEQTTESDTECSSQEESGEK